MPLTHIEYAIADAQGDPARLGRFEELFVAVLNDPNSELDAKRFIMRKLAVIGTATSGPAIAAHLETEGLADYAIRALEANGGPEAGALLRDALAAGKGPLDSIVRVLGARADGPSLEALYNRLGTLINEDNEAAAFTATALTGHAADYCDRILADFVQGNDGARHALGDALLQCAQAWATAEAHGEAVEAYEALWNADAATVLREAALQGLAPLAPDVARSAALSAVSEADPALYRAALGALRKVDNSAAGLPANAELSVLVIFAETGNAAAVEAIRAIVANPESEERSGAVEALGRFGNTSDVGLLLAVTQDSVELRRIGRAALSILPGDGATNEALVNEAVEGELGREALAALERRRANDQAAALLEKMVLVRPVHENRDQALDAISVVGGPAEAQALLELMAETEAEAVRKRMGQAATEIIVRSEDEALVAKVVEKAKKSGKSEIQASYIEVLGQLAPADGAEILAEFAQTRDEVLRGAAVRALAAWPNIDAIEALEGVARRRSSGSDRGVALEGYIRLLRASDLSADDRAERYKRALAFDPDTAGKRRIVSALSETVSLDALKTAATLRSDEEIQAEAATAEVRLSRSLAGAYPQEARAHLEPYLERPEDDNLRGQAANTLAMIDGFADYLVAWQVAGPYLGESLGGGDLFEQQFAPETTPQSVTWRILPAPVKPERPAWYLDLFEEMGGFERVAFLRNQVYSPEDQSVRLELGSDDGIKAWVNGDLVHQRMILRTAAPADDVVTVSLKKGWNDVMLAVYQLGSDWGAVARFAAADGSKLEGLETRLP